MGEVKDVSAGYDMDFHGWAVEQAALLRERRFAELDIDHVAGEIEELAGRERRELVSRLAVLLLHLLKWEFQSGLRGRSWELTIIEHREEAAELLHDSPSLRSVVHEALSRAYRKALNQAERETGLPRDYFPWSCGWTLEQVLDDAFWPDPDGSRADPDRKQDG